MILPATYSAALLLVLVCMFCWGSWANTYKLVGKWRFELFSYDWALGIGLCAVAAAFTFGSINSQDLTFQDNFLIASLRKMIYAVGLGMLLNLANLFFAGAVSVAGMSVAFPLFSALLVAIGALLNYFPDAQANPFLLFGGVACLVASVVLGAFGYGSHADSLSVAKPRRPDPKLPAAAGPASAVKGILLAVLSGVLMGPAWPLVNAIRSEENGVGPYGIALLMAAGIFFSTFLFVPFFMNFPVQGQPVEFKSYLKGSKKQHFWGMAGGIVWMAGTIAGLTVMSAPAMPGDTATYSSMAFAAPVVGALWGLLVWRDFKGSRLSVKMVLLAMLICYGAGAGMVALAPLYGK